MFCTQCGKQIPDGSAQCRYCGFSLSKIDKVEDPYDLFKNKNNGPTGFAPEIMNYNSQYSQPQLGMGWYKFLIYFVLWASLVLNVIYGIMIMVGGHYTSNGINYSGLVYLAYPSLRGVDIISGILIVGAGVLALIARQKLAAYSRKGPTLLYALYGYNLAVMVFYIIAVRIAAGLNVGGFFISSAVGSVVFLIINIIYFSHRKHMFTN